MGGCGWSLSRPPRPPTATRSRSPPVPRTWRSAPRKGQPTMTRQGGRPMRRLQIDRHHARRARSRDDRASTSTRPYVPMPARPWSGMRHHRAVPGSFPGHRGGVASLDDEPRLGGLLMGVSGRFQQGRGAAAGGDGAPGPQARPLVAMGHRTVRAAGRAAEAGKHSGWALGQVGGAGVLVAVLVVAGAAGGQAGTAPRRTISRPGCPTTPSRPRWSSWPSGLCLATASRPWWCTNGPTVRSPRPIRPRSPPTSRSSEASGTSAARSWGRSCPRTGGRCRWSCSACCRGGQRLGGAHP